MTDGQTDCGWFVMELDSLIGLHLNYGEAVEQMQGRRTQSDIDTQLAY